MADAATPDDFREYVGSSTNPSTLCEFLLGAMSPQLPLKYK